MSDKAHNYLSNWVGLEIKRKNKHKSCKEYVKHKKQRKVDQEDDMVSFVEQLHNTVWPDTNIDKFSELVNISNSASLEMGQGVRQETLLHR